MLVVVSDDVFSLAPLSVCIVLFSSWGMPGLCFSRENLHLPWKLVGPPIGRVAHLDGCPCSTTIPHSWHRVATASPPSLTLLPLRRAVDVVASAEGAESSASSSVCSPSEGTPYPRWLKCFSVLLVRPKITCFCECFWVSLCILDGKNVFQYFDQTQNKCF